jgi:MoxR-like ATPase
VPARVDRPAIYTAMGRFLDVLDEQGSLFTPGRSIWTAATLADLSDRVVGHPDFGPGSFTDKLVRQTREATPAVIQLAGEALFVFHLKDAETPAATKRLEIQRVLAGLSDPPPIPDDLDEAMESGVARYGRGKLHKWPHFTYLLRFSSRWLELDNDQRAKLRADAWAFRDILEQIKVQAGGFQQDAILHLVHPADFEPIISRGDKRAIVRTYGHLVSEPTNDPDRALQQIRSSLASDPDLGSNFTFYEPQIRTRWDRKAGPTGTPQPGEEPERFFILNEAGHPVTEGWKDQHGQTYGFDDKAAGRKLLVEAGSGRFVYYRTGKAGGPAAMAFTGHGFIDRVEALPDEDGRQRWQAHLSGYQPFPQPVPRDQGAPDGWSHQHSIAQITEVAYRHIVDLGAPATRTRDLDLAGVKQAAEERELLLEDNVYAAVVAALESGKHVVLTGPPGTAKTTLAEAVAAAAHAAGRCTGYVLTTATADWTTYDTIGGLRPTDNNQLRFYPGHFLDAIQQQRWLVIDELNRSNFDRAFGQLFTILSGQSVVLPYEDPESGKPLALAVEGTDRPDLHDRCRVIQIPSTWRVVATMNVFDKSLLFEMSFALMRRFAFIEVPAPADDIYQALIRQQLANDDTTLQRRVERILMPLLALRKVKELGPALFIDMARFSRARLQVGEIADNELTLQLFFSFLLPQFEGIDDTQGRLLYQTVSELVGGRHQGPLHAMLTTVLGVHLPSRATTAGGDSPTPEDDADEFGLDLP